MAISAFKLVKVVEEKYAHHFEHMKTLIYRTDCKLGDITVWQHTCNVMSLLQELCIFHKYNFDTIADRLNRKVLLLSTLLLEIRRGTDEQVGSDFLDRPIYSDDMIRAKNFLAEYGDINPEEEKLILWILDSYVEFSKIGISSTDDYIEWCGRQAAKSNKEGGPFSNEIALARAVEYLFIIKAANVACKYPEGEDSLKLNVYARIDVSICFDVSLHVFWNIPPVHIDEICDRFKSEDKDLEYEVNTHILNLCQKGLLKSFKTKDVKDAIEKYLASKN